MTNQFITLLTFFLSPTFSVPFTISVRILSGLPTTAAMPSLPASRKNHLFSERNCGGTRPPASAPARYDGHAGRLLGDRWCRRCKWWGPGHPPGCLWLENQRILYVFLNTAQRCGSQAARTEWTFVQPHVRCVSSIGQLPIDSVIFGPLWAFCISIQFFPNFSTKLPSINLPPFQQHRFFHNSP